MSNEQGVLIAQAYELTGSIARGGMGDVYAAKRLSDGQNVAIKVLRPQLRQLPEAAERFRREAVAAQRIRSEYVAQVLDVVDDALYGVAIVFELLEGQSLDDLLKREVSLSLEQAHPIVAQVFSGIADAHTVGVVHRDLKPGNVFLERREGKPSHVRLLDFGISKLPTQQGMEVLTKAGQNLGSFSYMAPEQIGSPSAVDHRADLYACGALIFRMLTGQLPYRAQGVGDLIAKKQHEAARLLNQARPSNRAAFSSELEAFVAKLLSIRPEERFASAWEALEAWESLAVPATALPEGSAVAPMTAPSNASSSASDKAAEPAPARSEALRHAGPPPRPSSAAHPSPAATTSATRPPVARPSTAQPPPAQPGFRSNVSAKKTLLGIAPVTGPEPSKVPARPSTPTLAERPSPKAASSVDADSGLPLVSAPKPKPAEEGDKEEAPTVALMTDPQAAVRGAASVGIDLGEKDKPAPKRPMASTMTMVGSEKDVWSKVSTPSSPAVAPSFSPSAKAPPPPRLNFDEEEDDGEDEDDEVPTAMFAHPVAYKYNPEAPPPSATDSSRSEQSDEDDAAEPDTVQVKAPAPTTGSNWMEPTTPGGPPPDPVTRQRRSPLEAVESSASASAALLASVIGQEQAKAASNQAASDPLLGTQEMRVAQAMPPPQQDAISHLIDGALARPSAPVQGNGQSVSVPNSPVMMMPYDPEAAPGWLKALAISTVISALAVLVVLGWLSYEKFLAG